MKIASIVLAACIALAACDTPGPLGVEPNRVDSNAPELGVVSWNVYVGARLEDLLQIQDPNQIPVEVSGLLGRIQATDFIARAGRLADLIARARPEVLSLQEISQFHTQSPGDFLIGNPVAAATPLADYLQILTDALAARGISYDVAAQVQNFDIELPMVNFSTGGLDDVRLTDFDVILVRSDVPYSNPQGGNFGAFLPIQLGGTTIIKPSGWGSIDVTVHGRDYRVFNTHLEAADIGGVVDPQLAALQGAQAAELMAIMDQSPIPVVLTGDLNSAAGGTSTTTYDDLLAAGFADSWLQGPSRGPGYTSNQAADLMNAESELFHRIDFVLFRNDVTRRTGRIPGVVYAERLGEALEDRTATGLWPSDHAGVWVRLTLPPGDGIR